MRIRIIGTSESAKAVRSELHLAGVVVADKGYGYTVQIDIDNRYDFPTIDGVDSDFERRFVNNICDCAKVPVLLLRPGGNQSDRHIVIGIPDQAEAHMIERGIGRAVVQMLVPGEPPVQPSPLVVHEAAVQQAPLLFQPPARSLWQRIKEVFTG